MLDSLPLVVLLPACLKEVYVTQVTIEPIVNLYFVRTDSVEERVFSFHVFDKQAFMFYRVKNL